MNAQKKRMAGKLLVSSLLALTIVGTTATAAEAATHDTTLRGTPEKTYQEATYSYPDLRARCHDMGGNGVVIREYVQDYPNEKPRVLRAILLCQWES